MNVSLSLKKLATKEYTLTAKERLMVIVAIGILVISITIYASTSEVAVEPTLPKPNGTAVNNAGTPALPIGKQVNQATATEQPLRDPFAKPPEVNNPKNAADPNVPLLRNNVPDSLPGMVPSMVPKSNRPTNDFKLTGIVSGENRQLAVIMSEGKSKAYGINDMVGAYRIKKITSDNVVLANNETNVVLHLESVSQKEGKN